MSEGFILVTKFYLRYTWIKPIKLELVVDNAVKINRLKLKVKTSAIKEVAACELIWGPSSLFCPTFLNNLQPQKGGPSNITRWWNRTMEKVLEVDCFFKHILELQDIPIVYLSISLCFTRLVVIYNHLLYLFFPCNLSL